MKLTQSKNKNSMKVKIKKLHKNAIVPYKTYDKDFCYDIVATSCEQIAPNVYRYGTGLAFQIDRDGYDKNTNLSIDFRPRSSVWKTGMVLSNCIGTVDELYRGEVMAVFYHVLPDMPKYEVGDRIMQCKIGITKPIEFEIVDALDITDRGSKGYGSTGK